jgi:Spy/CpxP family protein refolding chaperone
MNELTKAQKKAMAKVVKRLARTNLESKHDALHTNYELEQLDGFDEVGELIRAIRAIRAH